MKLQKKLEEQNFELLLYKEDFVLALNISSSWFKIKINYQFKGSKGKHMLAATQA